MPASPLVFPNTYTCIPSRPMNKAFRWLVNTSEPIRGTFPWLFMPFPGVLRESHKSRLTLLLHSETPCGLALTPGARFNTGDSRSNTGKRKKQAAVWRQRGPQSWVLTSRFFVSSWVPRALGSLGDPIRSPSHALSSISPLAPTTPCNPH